MTFPTGQNSFLSLTSDELSHHRNVWDCECNAVIKKYLFVVIVVLAWVERDVIKSPYSVSFRSS